MDERLLNANAIVFDVGNVLLTFEPQEVAKLLPETYREALSGVMFGPDFRWGAFDLGAEDNEAIARKLAEAAQVPDGKEMILYAYYHYHEIMRPLPLYHMIPEFRRLGKRIFALTNYGEPAYSFAKAQHSLLQLLDGEVVSSREKVSKPDPRIFTILLERYGLAPEETLYIDDALINVQSAASLGFRVWHYAGNDTL